MRVLAYIPLHYGSEYLDAAIKSIEDYVEQIIILYSNKPSFGFTTDLENPDKEEDLYKIATQSSSKVVWVPVSTGTEGDHRNIIYNYTNGYDLLLAVDSDEVWDSKSLEVALHTAHVGSFRRYNISGFINFWKSMDWACFDGFVPARIFNLNNTEGETVINGKVYHMGLAQRWHIVRYKLSIHGHKSEIRPGWFEDIFMNWNPDMRYLHPVSLQIWERALPFDKSEMPDIMKRHPNYNQYRDY